MRARGLRPAACFHRCEHIMLLCPWFFLACVQLPPGQTMRADLRKISEPARISAPLCSPASAAGQPPKKSAAPPAQAGPSEAGWAPLGGAAASNGHDGPSDRAIAAAVLLAGVLLTVLRVAPLTRPAGAPAPPELRLSPAGGGEAWCKGNTKKKIRPHWVT